MHPHCSSSLTRTPMCRSGRFGEKGVIRTRMLICAETHCPLGDVVMRRCPSTARSDALFCSGRCRERAHREAGETTQRTGTDGTDLDHRWRHPTVPHHSPRVARSEPQDPIPRAHKPPSRRGGTSTAYGLLLFNLSSDCDRRRSRPLLTSDTLSANALSAARSIRFASS